MVFRIPFNPNHSRILYFAFCYFLVCARGFCLFVLFRWFFSSFVKPLADRYMLSTHLEFSRAELFEHLLVVNASSSNVCFGHFLVTVNRKRK